MTGTERCLNPSREVLIGWARQAEINLNVRPQLDVDRQAQHCDQALIASRLHATRRNP